MADFKWGRPLTCPFCLADINASVVPPRDGDFSVCLFCGGVVRFTALATKLEKASLSDVSEALQGQVREVRRCVAAVYLDRDVTGEEAEAYLEKQASLIQKHNKP